jgi:serine/threonine protein kinase
MPGHSSDQNPERAKYEQTYKLFLDALDLEPPSEREDWVRRQSEYGSEVHENVLSMLRADASIEANLNLCKANENGRTPTFSSNVSGLKCSALAFPHLENFEIIEEIARGGMGVVYKAKQHRPNRIVAIKMIRTGVFASKMEIERFFTEAEAAAQLDGESVVPVYEFGEVKGEPYIAMKYIDGENLEKLLARNAMALPVFLNLLLSVCRAVSEAHKKGIIHRDIKPSNILIDHATGRPWISDFGIAKYLDRDSSVTFAGDLLGTPGYMAPEQAFGNVDSVTRATDVYGIGAILYRFLTGQPPIPTDSTNLASAIQLIRENDVIAPRSIHRRVPRELNTICMKCLETDAKLRYFDANELASELQRYLDGEAIHAKPLGWSRRLHRWARHRPGLAATWGSLGIFYSYYLSIRYFGLYSDTEFDFAAFDLPATLITASVAISAWIWQLLLNGSKGATWVLYAWVSCDIAFLTLLLFRADSANSPLVLLYHVIVAGSILRCRIDLVAYVTFLSMSGYALHLLVLLLDSKRLPDITTYMPMLLSLLLIGTIQYMSLRKSAASYESLGAAVR